MMNEIGRTRIETPNDTQVVVTRTVNAPVTLVFDLYTVPKHLQAWCTGPDGWSMPVCEMDLRVGGSWRWVFRRDVGTDMTMTGVYRVIDPPSRLVSTESWGAPWPDTVNDFRFVEADGRTTIILTITYPSKAARDAAMQTGMQSGMDASYARMERLLAALQEVQ